MVVAARILFLLIVLSCSVASGDQPNILLLFADDQRSDTIGAWGNEYIETPNIDELAKRGVSFRNNYCLGSNSGAVCMPSRAMLMTGLSYFRIDNKLTGQTLLPKRLARAGYQTFITGKWHNGKESVSRSFQHGKAVYIGGMGDHTKLTVNDLVDNELVNERLGGKFSSELFADATIDFLRSRDKAKPFFSYVALTSPHDPRQPPVEYRQKYYKKNLPKPPNFMPQHPFNNGTLVLRDEVLAAWPREWSVIQDQLAEYYGLIDHMDGQIGRIVEELKQQGLYENTIIIFAADHGLAIGSHGLLGKQSIYEHSMGCPLIIAGPKIRQAESKAFTYLLDIVPTILEAAKAEKPKELDGKSLWPIINGNVDRVRESVFLSYRNLMRSIRVGQHKAILYPPYGHAQLFNLEDDPHELKNLLETDGQSDKDRVANKSTFDQLIEKLKQQQVQFGDGMSLVNENPKPKDIDLSGRERKADRWQPKWIVEKYFE